MKMLQTLKKDCKKFWFSLAPIYVPAESLAEDSDVLYKPMFIVNLATRPEHCKSGG